MLLARMISEAGMENNTGARKKEVEKIIKALSSAKKPSHALLYFCILFSALLAMLVAINMHTHSFIDSLLKFSFSFSAISIFFIVFYSYINKVSIMSGLYVVNQWIDCMSRNDCNHPFPRHLHQLILIHPVFRVIAGLYLCKAGNNDDGVAMINKAASELPEINDCVSVGEISNTIKFGQLSNIVKQDLMPSTIFIMSLKVFLVLGALSILIRAIVFILSTFF
ncbi:MAG: hypothetical protein EHM79_11045 [Geobacter sp.]|nr:MAG: hypothetical protein EHM79_11045 [Geobacter sp.]